MYHRAAKRNVEQIADDVDWEDVDNESTSPFKPTDTEQQCCAFETNTAKNVIAVDHSNDAGVLETFTAFNTKLHAL